MEAEANLRIPRAALLATTLMITMGGLAMAVTPGASAIACATPEPGNYLTDYVARTCNYYIFGGEAVRDVDATVGFVGDQAAETVQFVWDTFGDDLP